MGFFAEILHQPVFFLLYAAGDRFPLICIILADKSPGQKIPYRTYESVHITGKFPSLPGRELDGYGFIGVAEIINITPVRRYRFCSGQLCHKTPDACHPAGPGVSGHENIKSVITYIKTKFQGPNRPFLADNTFQGF